MDELIFRQMKGRTTPDEDEQIAGWRAALPENEERYQLLRGMLRGYEQLEQHVTLTPPSTADVIRPRRHFRVLPAARSSVAIPWQRLVAGGVLAAGLVALGLSLAEWRQPENVEFGTEDFFTGKAERGVIELRDGTVVRLGPDSRLQVAASSEQREVTLTGRAFFAVAKEPGRPFIVHTSAGALTVLGTRFDVEARDRDLRVVVVEGRVALGSANDRTEVVAGEMSRVIEGKRLPTVRVSDAARFVDWVGPFLAFQSTPLSEVAREIERTYDVRVIIEDPVLAERTITAWFSERPLKDVMRVVCLAAAAHCTVENGVVRIASIRASSGSSAATWSLASKGGSS